MFPVPLINPVICQQQAGDHEVSGKLGGFAAAWVQGKWWIGGGNGLRIGPRCSRKGCLQLLLLMFALAPTIVHIYIYI